MAINTHRGVHVCGVEVKRGRIPVMERRLGGIEKLIGRHRQKPGALSEGPLNPEQYAAAVEGFPLTKAEKLLDRSLATIREIKRQKTNMRVWPKGRRNVPHVARIVRLKGEIAALRDPLDKRHEAWKNQRRRAMIDAEPHKEMAEKYVKEASKSFETLNSGYTTLKQGLIGGDLSWLENTVAAMQLDKGSPMSIVGKSLRSLERELRENVRYALDESEAVKGLLGNEPRAAEDAREFDAFKAPEGVLEAAVLAGELDMQFRQLRIAVNNADSFSTRLLSSSFSAREYDASQIQSLRDHIFEAAKGMPKEYASLMAAYKKGVTALHWKKSISDVQEAYGTACEKLAAIAAKATQRTVHDIHELSDALHIAETISADAGTALQLSSAGKVDGAKYNAQLEEAEKKADEYAELLRQAEEAADAVEYSPYDSEIHAFKAAVDSAQREMDGYGPTDSIAQSKVKGAETRMQRLRMQIDAANKSAPKIDLASVDERVRPFYELIKPQETEFPEEAATQLAALSQKVKEAG